jgi:uncharacterized surface anchored protein
VSVISDGSASVEHTTSTTVICNPSTVGVNQATSCAATVADTTTGPTTPTGTVTFTPGGTCTLAGTGVSSTCSVQIIPTTAGSLSVSASYGGDATHQTSSGNTIVTVVPTTGALKVTISGSNGILQGATVTIVSGPGGQSLPAGATTGADGSVTFTNLAPGTYTYKVAASGYEDKQVTATVAAGQTQSSQASLTQVQQAPSLPSVDYTLYAGLGAGVLVVLLGVFLVLRRRRVTPKSN